MNVQVQQRQLEIDVVEAVEVYLPSSAIFQNMVDFYPCSSEVEEEVRSRETTKLAHKALKQNLKGVINRNLFHQEPGGDLKLFLERKILLLTN